MTLTVTPSNCPAQAGADASANIAPATALVQLKVFAMITFLPMVVVSLCNYPPLFVVQLHRPPPGARNWSLRAAGCQSIERSIKNYSERFRSASTRHRKENSGGLPSLAQAGGAASRNAARLVERARDGRVRHDCRCSGSRKSPRHASIAPLRRPLHYDVVAFGELVVDLVPARGAAGEACFAPKPGGAPGNVAVGVARLGGRSAMLSKVGDDAFGKLLIATLVQYGVATEGVLTTREGNTSLAVVSVAADGERDFTLYRKGCAESTFGAAGGGLVCGDPISRRAQRHAVRTAREAGALVSVDVNLRPSLWRDQKEMRAVALEAAEEADVLKVSEEELTIMARVADIEEGL